MQLDVTCSRQWVSLVFSSRHSWRQEICVRYRVFCIVAPFGLVWTYQPFIWTYCFYWYSTRTFLPFGSRPISNNTASFSRKIQSLYLPLLYSKMSIPVAARSKPWVYRRWLAGNAGSNRVGAWVSLVCVVYCQRLLRWANRSSRGVLLSIVCPVW